MEKNKKRLLYAIVFMIVYLILNLIPMIYSGNIISSSLYENIENLAIYLLSIIGIGYYLVLFIKKDIDLNNHKVGILIFAIIFFIFNIVSGIFGFILYSKLGNNSKKKERRELPELDSFCEVNKTSSLILFIASLLLLFVLPNYINSKYYFLVYIILFIVTILVFRKQLVYDFKKFKEYFREYNVLVLKTWGKALLGIMIINLVIQIFTTSDTATNQESLQKMFNSLPIAVALLSMVYAPIVEEILFRGVFRKFINKKYLYIIISGFIFGLLHVIDDFQTISELLYIFVYSLLGCALASLYYKTNNICTNMYMHFLQNTLSVIGMIILKFM